MEKGEIAQNEQFHLFQNVFYAISIFKSCNSNISSVVCSFFDFGMVSKWCIREWVNDPKESPIETFCEKEKILVNQPFVLFQNCLLPTERQYAIIPSTYIWYLLFTNALTHSYTITPFDTPEKQAFRKHCEKRRNCS